MEQEIKNLIEKHYKSVRVEDITRHGDVIFIKAITDKRSYIALRILNKYPQIYSVRFTGDWTTHYFSRETLKWGGYKVKEHKK